MDKTHNCDSCASYRFRNPAKPSKISNNRFFRNFPPPIDRTSKFECMTFAPLDMPISIQPDPLRKLNYTQFP